MSTKSNDSIAAGMFWMFAISAVLSMFLPYLATPIAGFIGGRVAGSVRSALIAACIPGFVLVVGVLLFSSMIGGPIVGLISAVGIGFAVAVTFTGLFVGALIGGLTASAR